MSQNPFAGKLAEDYSLLSTICPGAAVLTKKLGDYVAALPGGPLRALEIGCGDGRSTRMLLESRPDITLAAFDASAKMLEEARRRLATEEAAGRVKFAEADALAFLAALPDASESLIVSNYVTHNFEDGYRRRVLAEIFRVLTPGGLFLNADRFAIDDTAAHLAATQDDVRHWFRTFAAMGRYDLLEDWVVHLFSDESPHIIQYLAPALAALKDAGFPAPCVEYREGVDTLVIAQKA